MQAAFDARRRSEEEEQRRREYEAEKARQATIARSKREAARRAMAGSGGDVGFGVGGGGFGSRGGGTAFAWKKSSSAPGKGTGKSGRRPDLPSHDECEMGVSAMVSRTQNGMKEGLAHLGLPNWPLAFVPGQSLMLCGYNLREEVNEMIHAWMTDEKDYFYDCLVEIKKMCDHPRLTEEDLEYVDRKDEWKKSTGPDGKAIYTKRALGEPELAHEEDDEEVIDVTPQGTRINPAGDRRPPDRRTLVASGGYSADAPAVFKVAPISLEEDHYAILGLDPSASLQDIRVKFRALVIEHHPEKGGDVKTFQRMNKAYGVLSDTAKRQEFDALRAASMGAGR